MFEFGDELIIESYRIPWLIWIQLLVMVLLVILLFCFSITANPSVIDTATTSNNPLLTTATGAGGGATSFSNFKVGENQIKENQTSTSRVIRRTRNEDIQQMEDPSSEDGERRMILEHPHHPCHIFGLAKQAFLKCLGFDSIPEESSSERKDRKDR